MTPTGIGRGIGGSSKLYQQCLEETTLMYTVNTGMKLQFFIGVKLQSSGKNL